MLPSGPYNPKDSEKEVLDFWLNNKMYKPEYDPKANKVLSTEEMKKDTREPWCLICPPPNAYGRPHVGNISGYAYMDAMGRYQRMKGKKVLLLPGKDHAGLEGEGVFVREVLEKKNINKFDLKREEFYQMIMDYNIENMQKALRDEQDIGLSADFDRNTFTLDPDIVETVLDTFVEMYKKGMIYKGVRLVNWDPKARTAVADNQIEYKDAETPFIYFKYGFLEPEERAVELKNKYSGKNITWIKEDHTLVKNEEISYLIGKIKDTEDSIIALGYENISAGTEIEGRVVGIQMRLDKNFKVVVVNPKFEGNVDELIAKAFLDGIKLIGGLHIIKFSDYADDKYYTNGFILGTVRPETKFGDTAIAVNPKDKRYAEFVGKPFEVKTLIGTAKLNIVSDFVVDPEFGTGMVKVTPAHSKDDWEIAQRHPKECLPAKQVIGYDLKLNHLCGKYAGLKAKEAREVMVEDMKKEGMLIHLDPTYKNRIQIAERTKAPIEPLLSSQWYLKYDGIKEAAMEMANGENDSHGNHVQIFPESMIGKFNNWMENLRDWAISRSLWWGYRLPVWYHGEIKEEIGEDGQVLEHIKITGSEEWVPLEYDNPNHLRVQKQNPDAFKLFLIPGRNAPENVGIYKRIKTKFDDPQNFSVNIVSIRNENDPSYEDYKNSFYSMGFDEKSVILARSMGCRGIIKYLVENKIKIDQLILMSPATDLSPNFESFIKNNLETTDEMLASLKTLVKKIYVIYSDNDEFANESVEPFEQLADKLSADKILEKGKKHFYRIDYENDSEEMWKLLKELKVHSSKLIAHTWHQDENVLDTWFSSGQWPFATLMKYNLMVTFYPTDLMVTMYDILENWVSRMMMFSYFKVEKEPFKDVYLTGMVLGTDGQKMSKSRGNLISMDEVRNEFGTDALRMTFFYQNSAGGSYVVSKDKLKNFRNFNNKLWNATRFVLMNISEEITNYELRITNLKLKESKELIEHINSVKAKVTKNLDNYEYGYATETLYEEFWHTFCDKWIEDVKKYLNPQKNKETGEIISQPKPEEKEETSRVLFHVLREYLKMLHPFVPFITEAIWKEIPKIEGDHESLMYTKW